ncbi:polyprenol monophosphomannose synthase [Leifsonia lichenia]
MNTSIVIIPTYNERDNLEWIVGRTLRATPNVDILIVDDGSPDGTGAIAADLERDHERVRYLERDAKAGLGAAYLAGFSWARANHYRRVIEMDADGSHHPEELPTMLGLLERYDLVLGSRWVPGGAVENWPLHRRLLSRGGNLYTRLALGISVRDATGGFRGFRMEALDRIDLRTVESHGYCFQVDVLWRGLQAGLDVVEFPIVFTERVHGVSKMSGDIVTESLAKVTGWGVRRRIRELAALLHGAPLSPLRSHRAALH